MNQKLLQAAWNGDLESLLKEINTNPYMLHSMALEGGETPLHIACLAGHLDFAATVIKLRQDFVWELNQDGFSPLHIAAASGHGEVVRELVKADESLCLIKGKDRQIPLHLAVVKGKVEVVKELLLSSLDSVECTTAQGETSLHLAVKNNQFDALQVLIQHLKQQYEVVDFLLHGEVMMELNFLNTSGLTPLDMLLMCRSESGDQDIEEILIQAGALKAENLQSSSYTQGGLNHPDTQNGNLQSPARKLLDYFKYNNLSDSPSKVRNILLVIVILITSATYQPALSPPGGTWQDDTISSTTNNTTTTKRHTAGEAVMATNNPIAYSVFLLSNSIGFYMSLHMISILTTAFPLKLELRISIYSLA
ncbi:ankyrin repeat-containing protein BDA1-like protein, partial [Tanacetum coccineum]